MPGDWPEGADGFAGFQADTPEQHAAINAVWSWAVEVSRGGRPGLVLWGRYGAGKSHLARAADRALFAAGNVGVFYEAPMWIKKIQSYFGRDADPDGQARSFRFWMSLPHFILDDLGTEHVKPESLPWLHECLFFLVNAADRGEGPALLITTNLTPEAMAQRVGGKVWSRLVGLCGVEGIVDMSAIPDHRMLGK